LGSQVVLARFLGPTAFGLYALGNTTVKVGGVLSQFGLDKGVLRLGANTREREPGQFKGVIWGSLAASTAIGILLGCAIFLLAPWLALSVFVEEDLTGVLRAFAPSLALYGAARVGASATTLSQRMWNRVKALDLIQPGVELLLIGMAYLLGWGLLGAIGAFVVSLSVTLIVVVVDLRRVFPILRDRSVEREVAYGRLVRFSAPIGSAALLAILSQSVDRYLVGVFRPVEQVGIYQAGAQGALLFSIILSSLNSIFLPMIADLQDSADSDRLEALYRVSTKWGLYASLPFFVVMVLMPGSILSLVFGSEYVPGAFVLAVLSLAQLINVGTGAVGLLLVMKDRAAQWNAILVSSLVLNVALGLLLIPPFGLHGGAAATACAMSMRFIAGLFFVRRDLNLWPYDARYAKGAAAAGAAAIVASAVGLVETIPLWATVVSATSLSVLAFGGALLLIGLDEEDRRFLILARNRFRVGIARRAHVD
jgi:O-antigen/teichoic acid export membrane protein